MKQRIAAGPADLNIGDDLDCPAGGGLMTHGKVYFHNSEVLKPRFVWDHQGLILRDLLFKRPG